MADGGSRSEKRRRRRAGVKEEGGGAGVRKGGEARRVGVRVCAMK